MSENTLLIDRRDFLRRSAALAALVTVAGPVSLLRADESTGEGEEDVSPAEDLMREHGALNRVLLIYEECARRLAGGTTFDPAALQSAAGVIHDFIENYHEQLEEKYLFPRFEKAGRLLDLVSTLRAQHNAGRSLTDRILATAKTGLKGANDRTAAAAAIAQFVRMYRPHEAREDTVLFPALRSLISRHEYDALGEDFEKKEHQLFGRDGFEGVVARIDGIERTLGIEDLAQFTPRL